MLWCGPRKEIRMRWIAAAATLVLLVACENRIVESSPAGVLIEGGEFAREAEAMAKAHCAKYSKNYQLMAVEPMTFVTWIHHYDCI